MTNTHSKNQFPFKASFLSTAISFAMLSGGGVAQAQDGLTEEIIVTGSFIRRSEGLSAASPVTQITSEDIEAQGTLNMAQIVQNMTFNNGTGVTNSIQGVTSRTAGFNLRGLGERATLELIDGMRTSTDNIQRMMPTIAIERMDIVTDGAAALYGTDAVAGVVNLVPYKSYEGTKIEYYSEGDDRGDFRDSTASFITGRSFGSVDFVAAGSYRDNGTLKWADRPSLMTSGLTHNSGANPANYNVPQRDANGVLTGAAVSTPEPSCGTDPVNDPTVQGESKFGTLALGRCWLSFGDTRDFKEDSEVSSLFSNLSWEVNDDLNLSAQMLWSRQVSHGRQNPGNPGARFADLPLVRGELPGNPFRAMTSDGRELYAQPLRDANGNIVMSGRGDPLPLRDANGVVQLAANQFAPLSVDPQGGIPFSEDVPMSSAWLPVGKANTYPSQPNFSGGVNRRDDDFRSSRIALTADFTVPYIEGWEGTAFYTMSTDSNVSQNTQQFSIGAIAQGLNCDVVNDADACFNPFGATEPKYFNTQAVADSIFTNDRLDDKDTLQTLNLILNGEISPNGFELPGGAIGAAVGYQRRDEEEENVPTLTNILDDQLIGVQVLPQTTSRDSDSYFAEFSFPVLNNLELSYAIRDEEFSTGQSDVVQKFGVVYSPTEWLTLRATQSEAFIVPTLEQLNRPESCGLSNVDDLFTAFSGFITSCISGNPDLLSENSDSKSVSVELTPIDNLSLTLTWSETDFSDRIVSTTSQDIVRTDYANFQRETGFNPTDAQPFPTVAQLEAWVNNPLSDKRIQRDPLDIETTTRIQQSDSNASNMLVKAFDLSATYSFEIGNLGNFYAQAQATYVDTYKFQLSQLDPIREAAGAQNDSFGAVAAIPEWRANAALTWNRGNHSATATVRYVDEVTFDANEFSFQRFFPGSTWQSTDVIRAWTQLDAYYTYRDLELLGGNSSISVGLRNATDREAQKTGMIAGAVAELQEVLGRVVYARLNYEF